MKKLNKYLVYVDNGKQTTKAAVTATSKKSVMKLFEEQGKVVAVNNLTEDHPIKADTLRDVLQASKRFDGLEVDWIIHALTLTGMVTDGTPLQKEAKPAVPEARTERKPITPEPKVEQKPAAPDAKAEQKPRTRKPAAPKQEAKPDVKPMEEKKSA